MPVHLRAGCALAVAAAMLLLAGCGRTTTPEQASERSPAEPAPLPLVEASPAQQAVAAAPLKVEESPVKPAVANVEIAPPVREAEEPAELPSGPREPIPLEEATDAGSKLPPVVMTDQHAQTCKLRVGDLLPQFELPDLGGQKRSLADLAGEKLTVVVFWQASHATALEELADLQRLVVDRFEKQGVQVIGVNVRDDPQLAAELVEQRGAAFANLSDRDGTLFAQVATQRLPRTYLLDATRKIVWFDLEYSRTTRQDLVAAIRFLLKP